MYETELAQTYQSPNPEVNQMASEGRKGDTMVAHVTPGDYVVPKDILVQHPEFLVRLKKVMEGYGEDYRTHMAGSGFENINPETGAPEFGWKKFVRNVGRVSLGIATGGLSEVGGKNSLQSTLMNTPKPTGDTLATAPYSPTEMKLPGSLSELGGLSDLQKRSYLATQATQGAGIGGNARDYYANLLQRNIAGGQGDLLPAESQYLSSQGINNNLSGQSLIEALRGF
jgi:hypothetical protein